MPWTTNEHGERVYKVSAFTKEDLPTWAELYDEWYGNRVTNFSRADPDQKVNQYWGIPQNQFLLVTACNQLNKMIFEDGKREDLLKFISDTIMADAFDVRFTCEPLPVFDEMEGNDAFESSWATFTNNLNCVLNTLPPIYTIPHPKGLPNPFIDEKWSRINCTDRDVMVLRPVVMFKRTESAHYLYAPSGDEAVQADDFWNIIGFLMKDVIDYFEGEGVGWKDQNGHLIDSGAVENRCKGVGFDPAL